MLLRPIHRLRRPSRRLRTSSLVIGAIAVAWIGMVQFAGCNRQPAKPLLLFVSGDTAGWITPCGCTANQSGGLARRATLIGQSARGAKTVYADVGGSASGTGEYQRLKFAAILRGLNRMGIKAHNIGGPETKFTPEELSQLARDTGVTWISANLIPQPPSAGSESPANSLASHVVVEHDGRSLALIGLVDPQLVTAPGWTTQDPVAAAVRIVRTVPADAYVVLAYFDEPGLRKLAEALPEVDAVIGGPTGQALSPTPVGAAVIASATNKGKFLTQLQWRMASQPRLQWQGADVAEVVSTLDEDPQQVANLGEFYKLLAERDLTVEQAGLVDREKIQGQQMRIAGSQSCASCHAEEFNSWTESAHHQAWDVLEPKGAHFDSYCQQCHATGYGMAGGFINVAQSKDRVDVGCENCHGPSSAHVADPHVRTPFQASEQCVRCHDHENSPEFQYDPYWNQVRHGEKTP